MPPIILRDGTAADEQSIVALNAKSAHVTSPMDGVQFRQLQALSDLFTVAEMDGQVIGFIWGFAENKAHDGVNYNWFSARLRNFFYIDRIVITESARACGLGGRIYAHLRAWALRNNFHWLAADIDIEPPNTDSLVFHKKQNFMQIGEQTLANGKTVSMQTAALIDDKIGI